MHILILQIIESAKELVTMLKDAQRGSKGLDVYTKLHKKHILALWSELCGDEQAGLSDVMTTFYSHLIKIAQEEVNNVIACIFVDVIIPL